MADASINIELKGIAQIKKELRELKGELASATDPQQMAELASRAGQLSDQLKDANEQVAVFASGSPFEQTNNALGLMGSQLASLDFEGASNSAKIFATAAKSINGEQIATQLKGLGGVVANLGKGFISLGATILANPIFLIAAAIAAIVTIIGVVLNKLGLLKPILKAVGDAFKFVGQVIDGVVQSIKDFLDWLGLTAFKAEESAQRQVDALEKVSKKQEDNLKKTVKAFDRQIELDKIDGKSTVNTEKEKQKAIIETSSQRYKSLVKAMEIAQKYNLLNEEDLKALKDRAIAAKEAASDARFEIQKINKQEAADKKKSNEEIEKSDKESYKKRLDDQKAYREARLSAARQIQDAELDLMEDGLAKDLKSNQLKYQRLIEDIAKNEKLTANEKKRLTELYAQEQSQTEQQIQKRYADELNKLEEDAKRAKEEKDKEESDARIAKDKEEKDKLLQQQKEFNEATLQAEYALTDARLGVAKGFVDILGTLAGENKKVANALFLVDKALAIGEIIVNTQREIAGYAANPTWSLLPDGGATIKASYIAAAKLRAGVSIATIAASSIAKFMNGGGGSVGGGGGANVGNGGGSTGAAATPSLNLFGQNNNANNLSAPQSMESGQNITVTAVVSETEMTNTQNKVKKIQQAASL
jgi:hypothetical protein